MRLGVSCSVVSPPARCSASLAVCRPGRRLRSLLRAAAAAFTREKADGALGATRGGQARQRFRHRSRGSGAHHAVVRRFSSGGIPARATQRGLRLCGRAQAALPWLAALLVQARAYIGRPADVLAGTIAVRVARLGARAVRESRSKPWQALLDQLRADPRCPDTPRGGSSEDPLQEPSSRRHAALSSGLRAQRAALPCLRERAQHELGVELKRTRSYRTSRRGEHTHRRRRRWSTRPRALAGGARAGDPARGRGGGTPAGRSAPDADVCGASCDHGGAGIGKSP